MYNCQYPQCMNCYQNPYNNPQMANMPQMNNPVSNIPMQNMPQNYTAVMPAGMYNQQPVPVMPANMYAQPQMMDMDDKRLEMMYPKVYFKAMPMIKHHCDMMEAKHGMMYCPTKEEMDKVKDDIYEKLDKEMDDDDEHEHHHEHHHDEDCECKRDNDAVQNDADVYGDRRRPRYGRGNAIKDLLGILLINELLGRRRGYNNPYYGWGY